MPTSDEEAGPRWPPVDAIRMKVDFLESYGRHLQDELRELGGETQDAPSPLLPERRWELRIASASTYREAGQLSLIFDRSRARRLLTSAGRAYLAGGHPFGLFLLAIVGRASDAVVETYARMLFTMSHIGPDADPHADDEPPDIPQALLHPQQQAYLLLTLVASPVVSDRHASEIRQLCESSPHRTGVIEVGALGVPIRHYWRLARTLLDGGTIAPVIDQLAVHLQRYQECLDSARSNGYLWEHAVVPVDIIDIDVLGISVFAARRFGVSQVQLMMAALRDRSSAAGEWLLAAGVELARDGEKE